MKTTTNLVTTFLNGAGNKHRWTCKEVNPDLSAEQIKEACELMTTLELFEKDGVKLFTSAVGAKYVTISERTIFDKTTEENESQTTPQQAPVETQLEIAKEEPQESHTVDAPCPTQVKEATSETSSPAKSPRRSQAQRSVSSIEKNIEDKTIHVPPKEAPATEPPATQKRKATTKKQRRLLELFQKNKPKKRKRH